MCWWLVISVFNIELVEGMIIVMFKVVIVMLRIIIQGAGAPAMISAPTMPIAPDQKISRAWPSRSAIT